jgi:hypothetical protein
MELETLKENHNGESSFHGVIGALRTRTAVKFDTYESGTAGKLELCDAGIVRMSSFV